MRGQHLFVREKTQVDHQMAELAFFVYLHLGYRADLLPIGGEDGSALPDDLLLGDRLAGPRIADRATSWSSRRMG